MKKKCRCITKTHSSSLVRGAIYYYNIVDDDGDICRIFPYFIYADINDEKEFATFSKGYFDAYFVDINVERSNKIKMLNETSLEM